MTRSKTSGSLHLAITLLTVSVVPLACTPVNKTDGGRSFRNVVLISIDTCRPDHLSAYGYPRETTPNIDAVAADGVLFTRAYSTNPMTLPAHSSMLTGTPPPRHGVHGNNNDRLADSNLTLAEVLQGRGFQTAAFVSAFVLDSIFGLSQGFDTYGDDFAGAKKAGKLHYNERRAEEVSRAAIAWLDEHHDRPFFLFLHYFDPHQPYAPPAPFDSTYRDAPYAGEIAYADHHIGRVLEKMKELGLYESTLLVITSDHGESLGEHGEETHAYFAYDSTIHIPLIIRLPGGGRGLRVNEPVSLVDIAPSIVELAAIPRPERFTGQSLAAGLRGAALGERNESIYFESLQPMALGCAPYRGIVDGRWKYLRAVKGELYDLEGAGDEVDLAAGEPERTLALESRLDAIAASEGVADAEPPPLDSTTRERLRALGYLTASKRRRSAANLSDPKECFVAFQAFLRAHTLFNHDRFAEAEAACLTAIAERPKFLNAHALLGTIALEQHRTSEAEQRFRQYLQVLEELRTASPDGTSPSHDYSTSRVRNNLGNALVAQERFDEAIPEYREALRLAPTFAEAHLNLGTALEATGDESAGIAEYRTAIRLKSDFVEAQKSLGHALKSARQFDEAAAALSAAAQLDPDDADVELALAWVEQKRGNTDAALRHYKRALAIKPEAMAYNNLAWLYATHWDERVRDAAQAVTLATRAAELTEFRDPGFLDTLAAAYASAGRFEDAVETTTRALELARSADDGDTQGLEERLALFRAGEPYRQTPP